MMQLAGEGGRLTYYSGERIVTTIADHTYESLMGLEKYGDGFYVGARSKIHYLLPYGRTTYKSRENPQFHKIKIINEELYVTCTGLNEIWRFSLGLDSVKRYGIDPPNRMEPIEYGKNYNHINSIAWNVDHFLVLLNWYEFQYGYSGICALDDKFFELFRYSCGWEAHSLQVIDGQIWMLCSSSRALGRHIYHPHKTGIMIDGEMTWETDPDTYFLKDMAITSNFIYVAGGHIKHRENRAWDTGIVFVLDRNFQLQDKLEIEGSGGLCGVLLD